MKPRHPMDSIAHTIATYSNVFFVVVFVVCVFFFFPSGVYYYVGDDSEAWKDKDVDFRVAKESEEVLVQDEVSWVKEHCIKFSVGKRYRDIHGEDW